MAVGVVCLGAIVYASAHHSPWVWSPPQWTIAPFGYPSVQPMSMPPNSQGQMPDATSHPVARIVLIVVAILLALAVLILLVRWIVRAVRALMATRIVRAERDHLATAGTMPGSPLSPQEVVDAVQSALQQLDGARDPSDAVIAAWLALEQAASRHGMTRDPAQTPTEFTATLFEQSAAPPEDTINLRDLYSRVRFSDARATASDVSDARRWLGHIARSLEGVVAS